MTSIPPAEPRPPPSPRLQAHPNKQPTSTPLVIDLTSPRCAKVQIDAIEPPAKRRRIDTNDATNPYPLKASSAEHSASAAQIPAEKKMVKISWDGVGLQNEPGKGGPKSERFSKSALPGRPWARPSHPQVQEPPPSSHRIRKATPVPNTPDILVAPDTACRLEKSRVAGFFPWIGNHPEDVINDVHVKSGYFDKPPTPPDKELNTARNSLSNILKHRSGLENVSTLFSLVLEQKNRYETMSSVSNFRPPPRVTLTEAKRKQWISNLANSETPLKRLSRTIPQGIRGQVLLDQCLINDVPLSRAIWFAKCVGAYEIRTLRRKGTNPVVATTTEAKWLRDWTINVEQFIETLLHQREQQTWRSNIQYALRLTTRLFQENLVDRDHYLDWIVKSLASGSDNQLPFWLMLVCVHLRDICCFQKRGKRFAQSLLDKHRALMNESTTQKLAKVLEKISRLLRQTFLLRPMCFLLPDEWADTEQTLRLCLNSNDPEHQRLLDNIATMNEQVMGWNKSDCCGRKPIRQIILDSLNSAEKSQRVADLSDELLTVTQQISFLVTACIQWSITSVADSESRIYTTCRLFRKWQQRGHDLNDAILEYLESIRSTGLRCTNMTPLRHLIAELSRTLIFSNSKYLQWMSARGLPGNGVLLLKHPETIEKTPPFDAAILSSDESIQFLTDLCMMKAPRHVLSLRNTLLEQAGYQPDMEERVMTWIISTLDSTLQSEEAEKALMRSLLSVLSKTSWSIRYRTSAWVREWVVSAVPHHNQNDAPRLDLQGHVVTIKNFFFLRAVVEACGDYAVLADVIRIVSSVNDNNLLTAATETMVRWSHIFRAIGAFVPLHNVLCHKYLASRVAGPFSPTYTITMLDFSHDSPTKTLPAKLVQHDLMRGDRGRAIAACSPFSDGIEESLQQAGETFVEDFEAILQSEPNMNEQTMSRLFAVLTERIEKESMADDNYEHMMSLCLLLTRLKLFRPVQGKQLTATWVTKLMRNPPDSSQSPNLLSLIVAANCADVSHFFQVLQRLPTNSPNRQRLLQNIRNQIFDDTILGPSFDTYRVSSKWLQFASANPFEALELAAEMHDVPPGGLFGDKIVLQLGDVKVDILASLSPRAISYLRAYLDQQHLINSAKSDITTLITSADVLSMPLVQLRLRLLAGQKINLDPQVKTDLVNAILVTASKLTSTSEDPPGSFLKDLISAVGGEIASMVRFKVEEQFFEVLPRALPSKTNQLIFFSNDHEKKLVRQHLVQAFQLCRSPVASPHANMSTQLIERLTGLIKVLNNHYNSTNKPNHASNAISLSAIIPTPTTTTFPAQTSPSFDVSSPEVLDVVLACIDCILQMICLERASFNPSLANSPSATVKQLQQDQHKLLALLSCLFLHPGMTQPFGDEDDNRTRARQVASFALLVACTLVDDLADDGRQNLARCFKEKLAQDDRLRWLFGSTNALGSVQASDLGKDLLLSKEGKGIVGEWKPKVWEVVESGAGGDEDDSCIGLGLFGARKVQEMG